MNFKEWVLDRIETSFSILFSKNFWKLISPIFIYKLVIWIFLWNFISFVVLWNVDANSNIFASPFYIIIFVLIIFWFIFYITFFVGIFLATIKNIKDLINSKEINLKQNIKYWIKSIIPSFNTYWYIFAYITLWPFLFIAIWWIMIILWMTLYIDYLKDIWWMVIWFWFLLLFIFMIYRWVKITFSLVSAVDKDSYTKENFLLSVKITNNNWWRIVGNFLLLSLILSIILWIISVLLSTFSTGLLDVINVKELIIKYMMHNLTQDDINMVKTNILKFYDTFYLNNFLLSIVNLFLDTFGSVLLLIFTYIFYKRLCIESWIDSKEEIINKIESEKQIIEL